MQKKKVNKKREKVTCMFCNNDIDIVDNKYVQLSTFNAVNSDTNKKFDKHVFYHWQCFLDQYQQGIDERIKERLGGSLETLKKIMENPLFQNLKIQEKEQ